MSKPKTLNGGGSAVSPIDAYQPQWIECFVCGDVQLVPARAYVDNPYLCRHCRVAMPDEEFRHLHDDLAIHHPERLAKVDDIVARIRTECGLCEFKPKDEMKNQPNPPNPPMPQPKKEADEELTDFVYCRRHRRTKPVPKGWTDTCSYLCHKCYRRLSPEERKEYAGRDTFRTHLKAKTLLRKQPQLELQPPKPEPVLTQPPSQTTVPEEALDDKAAATPMYIGNAFKGLMPQYSINCLRCGNTSPCHYHWFSRSKVLCPTCYSSMNQWEIDNFHRQHGNKNLPIPPKTIVRYFPMTSMVVGKGKSSPNNPHEDSVLVGRKYSNERISKMTRRELAEAVKKGYVSRPRARIELHRRKREEYYHMLPEVPGLVM